MRIAIRYDIIVYVWKLWSQIEYIYFIIHDHMLTHAKFNLKRLINFEPDCIITNYPVLWQWKMIINKTMCMWPTPAFPVFVEKTCVLCVFTLGFLYLRMQYIAMLFSLSVNHMVKIGRSMSLVTHVQTFYFNRIARGGDVYTWMLYFRCLSVIMVSSAQHVFEWYQDKKKQSGTQLIMESKLSKHSSTIHAP